ncbi:MAG: signal peptidase II [Lachnospiraceae bacterium]|nr:signal peptidase II [Lachnospiraceae bacterium]
MREALKKNLPAIIIAVILISLDQITKAIARCTLTDSPFILIDGVFEFRLVFNTGVAWGLFNSVSFLITVFSFILMFVISFLYYKMPKDNKRLRPLRIMLILLFSGAVGNVIDRLFYSAVTDFLYFSLIDFPVFNIADCYVTVGGILTAVLLIFYYKDADFEFLKIKRSKKNREEDSSDPEKDETK